MTTQMLLKGGAFRTHNLWIGGPLVYQGCSCVSGVLTQWHELRASADMWDERDLSLTGAKREGYYEAVGTGGSIIWTS